MAIVACLLGADRGARYHQPGPPSETESVGISTSLGLPMLTPENEFEVASNLHLMREMIFRTGKDFT